MVNYSQNNLITGIFATAMVIFLLIIGVSCTDQSQTASLQTKSINIDSLEKQAVRLYQSDPATAAELFSTLAEEARRKEMWSKSATTHLNLAGLHEEQLNDPVAALSYARESLADWQKLNDSMQIANLYKYVGLLEGKNDQFKAGEQNIQRAMDLYRQLSFESGIAVSSINLAQVKLLQGEFDEALRYFDQSKKHWQEKSKPSRIFDNNLVGIRIYQQKGDLVAAKALVEENDNIKANNKINSFLLNKFEAIRAIK